MNASKFFLKAANSLVTAIVALFLILAAAYSGYALWDNAQVYGAVYQEEETKTQQQLQDIEESIYTTERKMKMTKIAEAFQNKKAFIGFLTAGDPSLE